MRFYDDAALTPIRYAPQARPLAARLPRKPSRGEATVSVLPMGAFAKAPTQAATLARLLRINRLFARDGWQRAALWRSTNTAMCFYAFTAMRRFQDARPNATPANVVASDRHAGIASFRTQALLLAATSAERFGFRRLRLLNRTRSAAEKDTHRTSTHACAPGTAVGVAPSHPCPCAKQRH